MIIAIIVIAVIAYAGYTSAPGTPTTGTPGPPGCGPTSTGARPAAHTPRSGLPEGSGSATGCNPHTCPARQSTTTCPRSQEHPPP